MKRTPLLLIVLLSLVVVWVVGLGCWPLITWSRLNCSCEDIDINSGRTRYQRYLIGLCIRESVEETALSRLVSEEGEPKPAVWRRVNTFSPMVHHSPHYRYHGAIWQAHYLEGVWDLDLVTPRAQRQMARDVLTRWSSDDRDDAAGRYLNEIEAKLKPIIEHNRIRLDVDDLPK